MTHAAIIAAKGADQYMLRLPPGLRERIAERARENGRSINTEIIGALQHYLDGTLSLTERIDRLERAVFGDDS